MIISNGTIEVKQKKGHGVDPITGHPIRPESVATYSAPILCQYVPVVYNALAVSNGEHYTNATYQILLEEADDIAAEQIRLKDAAGASLGEFSIKQKEALPAVCQIRLWV